MQIDDWNVGMIYIVIELHAKNMQELFGLIKNGKVN